MQISKREFLKRLGLGGAGLVGGVALADEFVATSKTLPPGAIGDPDNVWFGQRIYPLPHTIEDGPSCYMKDGKIVQPAREIPIFHETDVVVVGGGPAGFAAADATGDWDEMVVNVAQGAKLDLDYIGTNKVHTVRLGNHRRTGIISAETYPDFVTGSGALEVTPTGTIMIFR